MEETAGTIYRSMGVTPIISAAGPISIYGGARRRPQVVQAMMEASRVLVRMDELNVEVGKKLAQMLGVESAFVSSGAAGGLVLQAAACIAGTDETRMRRLPDSAGMKNEIVMQLCQRYGYEQCYSVGGGRIVDAGSSDGCNVEELVEAFSQRTVAAAYLFSAHSCKEAVPFREFCDLAHSKGVPVIVDAANFLPPRANMSRFMKEGADMVTFSGGKAVRGPQGAGILLGTAQLIEAARANASPNKFVARSMKVSKEEVIGLLTAVELFINEDESDENRRYMDMCGQAMDKLSEIPGITVSIEHDGIDYLIPTVAIRFNQEWRGLPVEEILSCLANGNPPVFVRTLAGPGEIGIDPMNLDEDSLNLSAQRIREVLLKGRIDL